MTAATFILSLDCEGKWGAADRLSRSGYGTFTTSRLTDAYRRLVETLDRHEIPATFAFTACFFLRPEEVRENADWFRPTDALSRNWFAPFQADFDQGRHDGWLCPDALDAVVKSGAHEVASHGFSHLPLGHLDVAEDVFRREMTLIRAAEARRGLHSDTFVYPRNRIGSAAILPQFGFRAYRPPVPRSQTRSPLAKLRRYANDLNPLESPQPHSNEGNPILLPPGRILPVRAGNRRWIPLDALRIKFETMLRKAVHSGDVVHVFTHPHNFITGRRQFDVLDTLLAAVSQHARCGTLRVETQRSYCGNLAKIAFADVPRTESGGMRSSATRAA